MQPKRDRLRAAARQRKRESKRRMPTNQRPLIPIGDPHKLGVKRVQIAMGPIDLLVPLDGFDNPNDLFMTSLVMQIANIGSAVADLQTVIGSLPGCGKPADDLPSLFVATDAVRDALARMHAAIDLRADMATAHAATQAEQTIHNA